MTSNLKTAQLLKRVAAVFRVIEGDTFRYKAYLNAAISIENLTESLEEIHKNNELDSVPGIGPNLKRYLSEYLKNGKARHFDSILQKVPQGMFPLMDIRGIGPITAFKIAKKFKLNESSTALSELRRILKEGRLSEIVSFHDKTIARIKKAISAKLTNRRRLLLSQAIVASDDFIKYLKKSDLIKEAEPLGSLRRKLPTVGDIDIGICAEKPVEAMTYALKYPMISTVVSGGENVSHVKLHAGTEMDIKISSPDNWGSMLQHYTGSRLHNIKLRTIAKDNNLTLSEYGIQVKGQDLHFKTEEDFYSYLGMQYIPPEIREGSEEIALATHNELPRLVEDRDIKGDLHIHSNFLYPSSHDTGSSPLSEILDFSYSNGYTYVGITDHNPKFTGMSEVRKEQILMERKKLLENELRAYENRVKKRGIKLLIGMEVDIRPDGSLSLSDKLLNSLDYTIVSVHSSFDQTIESNTRRMIKALSHPKAVILGHPTGQILNLRDQISADWEQIFTFCAANKKIVEVNASPLRADLPSDLIKRALSFGVKLVINTDSHTSQDLENMKYGVWQARRGWCTKKSVINTYSFKKLHSMLKLS